MIEDLVPLREVAAYRSYVNIVQTVGRSCGGPIGGALAQSIGWRWAFLLQTPLTVIAMVLVAWKLKIKPKSDVNKLDEPQTIGAKLKRIDFMGALFLSSTILGVMLILDLGGEKTPWTSPTIAFLAGGTLFSGMLFYVTEKSFAREPIFPLRLLSRKAVILDYLLISIQTASQIAVRVVIQTQFV